MHTHFGGLGADYFADMWRKFAGRAGPVKVPLSPLLHTAAARAGLRVSVKVSGAVVYLWKVGTRVSTATPSSRPAIMCEVCGKPIPPLPGTSKQFVCGGVEGRKSRCQKIRRRAREHGISISEALARWQP